MFCKSLCNNELRACAGAQERAQPDRYGRMTAPRITRDRPVARDPARNSDARAIAAMTPRGATIAEGLT